MEFSKSRTFANLMSSFAGESQARTKYNIYGKQASKQGYEEIKEIFDETAKNELAHAKVFLQLIHDGAIPDTLRNLTDGAGGEHREWSEIYKDFAQVAKEEGYGEISEKFELIASVEKEHEARYRDLIQKMNNKTTFKTENETVWICQNCGHIHYGKEAPNVCPLCNHPQSYFKQQNQSC